MASRHPPVKVERGDGNKKTIPSGSTADFLMALAEEVSDAAGLTPAAISRAIVRVLPVDGASLVAAMDVLHIPLGFSSIAAARAEELQASLGEGPCLEAFEAQAPVVMDLPDLTGSWPVYAEELTGRTPFRAVAAIPLSTLGHEIFAGLELYATNSQLSALLDLVEVGELVAAPAAALLGTCVEQVRDVEDHKAAPEWYQSAAGPRHDVWVAIGMVMAVRAGCARDALSLLRAHAYIEGRSLDALAADVVDGRIPPPGLTD